MGRRSHCSDYERNLIKKLRNEGKTYREISGTLGCSENMVTNALKYKNHKETRGRKRKTSSQTDRRIVNIVKADPFQSTTDILGELDLNISKSTIRRRLCESNLHGRSPRKVPLLSAKNIRDRKKFAKDHSEWKGPEGSKKWRNVLWSDESKINLFGSDGRCYVRRPPGKEFNVRFTKKTVKHGGGNIKIWGCFSWFGPGPIHWIREIMDQHVYTNILDEVMFPYADENMPLKWTFQQDNDPKHTSKKAKEWFRTNKVSVMEWPAQSPDLNPIEHLWKDVKVEVAKLRPKNANDLWTAVQKVWSEIPIQRCQRLIESMPDRCVAVLKNNGQATKY